MTGQFSVARNIDLAPGAGWFIVHTAEACEHRTAQAIIRDGFRAYMPGVVLTTKYRCRHTRKVRLALFPEYLFAGFERGRVPDVGRAWRRQGAQGLLMRTGMTGVPWEVPAAAVTLIWKAERDGLLRRDVDRTKCQRADTEEELRRIGYAIGQEVDWDWDGQAAGGEDARIAAIARIKDVEPDMRVRLLFTLFNREVEEVVPVARLARG